MVMKKYMVIYRSVLMENLQYVMDIAMGFISYFIFIYVYLCVCMYICMCVHVSVYHIYVGVYEGQKSVCIP